MTERGLLLEADVFQVITDLARKGKRDPSMKELADRLNQNGERKESITSNKVGWSVRDKLKLPGRTGGMCNTLFGMQRR